MTDVLIDVTTELTFYNEFDYLTDENYTDLIESILIFLLKSKTKNLTLVLNIVLILL